MATKTAESVEARETFAGVMNPGTPDRVDVVVREGDIRPPDDPVVKKWPDRFRPLGSTRRPSMEQATAGPGEKRG